VTTNQLFFALAGLLLAVHGLSTGFLKYYIDAKVDGVDGKLSAKIDGIDGKLSAKIDAVDKRLDSKFDTKIDALEAKIDSKLDSLSAKVDLVVQYMILHQGKIATLEERTKNL